MKGFDHYRRICTGHYRIGIKIINDITIIFSRVKSLKEIYRVFSRSCRFFFICPEYHFSKLIKYKNQNYPEMITPGMITLTFNQWVMIFVTGVVIILLFACIAILIIDKKHREDPKIPRSRIYPFNKENEPGIVFIEMYNMWIGRIIEIVSRIRGNGTGKIDVEHFLSVCLWILTPGTIAGYFLTWYSWDILCFVMLGMAIGSNLYAHWRHDEPSEDFM